MPFRVGRAGPGCKDNLTEKPFQERSHTRRGGIVRMTCLSVAIALVACVAATAEPKMLSKEEAAAGWINLFDGETTFGWTASGDAQWKIDGGNIVCAAGTNGALATTSEFADFKFSAKVRLSAEDMVGIGVRADLDGHPSENGSGLLVIREPKDGGSNWHTVEVEANGANLSAKVDGKDAEIKGSRGRGHTTPVSDGREPRAVGEHRPPG